MPGEIIINEDFAGKSKALNPFQVFCQMMLTHIFDILAALTVHMLKLKKRRRIIRICSAFYMKLIILIDGTDR